tara:strand:- start:748 stop:1371 length:624 start_codon:yes stop_codon:yes gene_type:complete
MIRKYFWTLLFLGIGLIGFSAETLGQFQTSYYGPTTLENQTHPMLTIFGPATLRNVTVTGKTSLKGSATLIGGHYGVINIHGPFRGVGVTCQTLEAYGPVSLNSSDIQGQFIVNGPLTVDGGTFQDISVAADEVTLKDAQLQSLTVRQNHPDHPRPQAVSLEGTTSITGDIIFEGKNGVVRVKNDTVTFKGNLENGRRENLFESSLK